MTKLNYERMYKDLTNEIIYLKGTDKLGQLIETKSVINLLNVVEDREKELLGTETVKQSQATTVSTGEKSNSIRDFARKNRLVKG
ncbi:hypothetical protein [Carnobacterium jeotgali]